MELLIGLILKKVDIRVGTIIDVGVFSDRPASS